MTPTYIQQLIDTANVTQTGVVEWAGDNGLKVILSDINANSTNFGVKTVDTLAQLSTLSGSDANLVSVKQVGLYRFNPNASQAQPTSVSGINGIWMLETSYSQVSKYQKVFGNGNSTTFDFQHNLGVQYPSVTVWLLDGIYPELVDTTLMEIHSISPDITRVAFDSAPTLNSYLINIQ